MKYVAILGSTGSIGRSTLDVIHNNLDKFIVFALIAKKNVTLMTEHCLIFQPKYVCMENKWAAQKLQDNLSSLKLGKNIQVLSGCDAVCEVVTFDCVDIVMAAIGGVGGLLPTLAAVRAGKTVLLANKEVLVSCGKFFMQEVCKSGACLLPVDSEHSAIFQSLPESFQRKLGYNSSLSEYGISRIVLTGSGGPFYKVPLSELSRITPKQACCHPNWSMGPKISVDSATMMNKGLEYIEARLLFNTSIDEIEVLLHPQSIIHSMVRYIDGSILAQLGLPDMRISISYAMSYPDRIISGVKSIDFLKFGIISFDTLDYNRYPCFKLAIEASICGQAASIILNAANEVAVDAFLCNKIRFTEISKIISLVLSQMAPKEPNSIDDVLFIDQRAREKAVFNVNHCKF